MATSTVSRLASVTARDGVNTRTKVNWASAVARPRKTICRSDMIIGLGQLAVQQSYNGTAKWGDVMTDREIVHRDAICESDASDYEMWEDMANEPWKYGEDIVEWLALNEKLIAGPDAHRAAAFWRLQMEDEEAELTREQAHWRKVFNPIAKSVAMKAAVLWIKRDIKRMVARVRNGAVKMQSLVRGYQARCKNVHLDCCMCLSHRISPLKTGVGYMCRECAADGPFADIVSYDDWGWHRTDYVEVCA